jgi:EAL domain-containing protein (putative c-di-GMP-specific phosphodiesterase class I)
LIQDESSAVKILAHIASLGGAASIDDFGSGFHSLEQMKSLPLSTLKIASRFIQKIDQNEDANKMVQIIINLARQLGLKSLAETVETEAQYQFLKNTGCDRAQGYFISRPLTPDLLQDFLKNHE